MTSDARAPGVVGFFEDIRRRRGGELEETARVRSGKRFAWNFLPPIGQFQNGDTGRAIALLTVEATSLAGAAATALVLNAWRRPDNTYERTETARTLKTWNHIAVAGLAASYVVGVADAILRFDRDPTEDNQSLTFMLLPTGAAMRVSF